MGRHGVLNNNNSSNVLSQQRILDDLNQMTKNDLKPQVNNHKKGPRKNQRQQQQQQQQKVQQPQTQPQQQQQKAKKAPKPTKPTKPDTSVRNTYKLLSNWEFYTNNEWKNNTNANIQNIQSFANKKNIRSQLDNVQEIQVKYTYKPEKKQSSSELTKKANKKRLREITKAPPGVHEYRMKQFLQELNQKKQQKEMHDRVTNLLIKRYTQKMNAFADEYQKAYKVYQESIKDNLGVAEIKNSQINAQKTFSHQKRIQKKAKLQKKMFRNQRKRILESHTSPAKWTEANEKLFQTATQKILVPSYNGFHFFGRPEYNRDLAWVEANENTTHKQSISVATIMACQNSPIPGETRLSQNRVPTVAPTQQMKGGNKDQPQQQKQKKQQTPKEKPMTIKTQTPEQYRERITGKKEKKTIKNEEPNDGKGKKGGKSSPTKMEKTSPTVINPRPATWVTETELPDTFAWGILQHQPGNGNNGGRSGNRNGGKKNKDETLNILFPKSAPNQGGNSNNNKQPQQNGNGNGKKQQNRKQKGINISDML